MWFLCGLRSDAARLLHCTLFFEPWQDVGIKVTISTNSRSADAPGIFPG